jgi:nucleoid-associated protein YgaU
MDDPVKKRFGMAPKKEAPKMKMMAEHTVAAGETLSDISLKYYKSAVKDKYMMIYEANKAAIGDNPNMIKPGMVLKIPEMS